MSYPLVIQGGMGAAVSNWVLANAVSRTGQLGVVSGTALDTVLLRRLQLGDPEGHIRRALAAFPIPEIAQRILDQYFIPGGKKEDERFKSTQMFSVKPSKALTELNLVGNFVEVFLAKEGHSNPVGINYLEKIQMPNLSAIYGAMLAGVDYVLMGAGIPREIPGILDKFANHQKADMKIAVDGADVNDEATRMEFDPAEIVGKVLPPLKRPLFLAIISSAILALTMVKKATGKVDGFIIEGPTAGGHNAPPRGGLKLDDTGQPLYSEKDDVDLEKISKLGLPFWLAGGYGSPEKVKEALAFGATGVQVGTAFAFCVESGLDTRYRLALLEQVKNHTATIFTDPHASPTDFPFKVAAMRGSMSEQGEYEDRTRICDLGFLRHVYKKEDGGIGYRCPAEPAENYMKKGGLEDDTIGKKCLCNGLMANVGYPQVQKGGYVERPLVTAGDDLIHLRHFTKDGLDYTAESVVDYLLGK